MGLQIGGGGGGVSRRHKHRRGARWWWWRGGGATSWASPPPAGIPRPQSELFLGQSVLSQRRFPAANRACGSFKAWAELARPPARPSTSTSPLGCCCCCCGRRLLSQLGPGEACRSKSRSWAVGGRASSASLLAPEPKLGQGLSPPVGFGGCCLASWRRDSGQGAAGADWPWACCRHRLRLRCSRPLWGI